MPDALVELLGRYGYALIFVGVLVDNLGVPGPSVVMAGAFFAELGRMSPR